MQKLWSYFHFTGSGNGSVTGDRAWFRFEYRSQSLVPDCTGGSGTGTGAKFSSGRVLPTTWVNSLSFSLKKS